MLASADDTQRMQQSNPPAN